MTASEQLLGMFAALNKATEAGLCSSSEAEFHQRVCDATLHLGNVRGAAIFVSDDTTWLRVSATAGPSVERLAELRLSTDPASAQGQELGGRAFRTAQLHYSKDVLTDPLMRSWWGLGEGEAIREAAALPLVQGNQPHGLMFVFFAEETIDSDVVRLLNILIENISAGAEVLRRDRQKSRLARMYSALSAIGGIIMRAQSRIELFQRACETAVLDGIFAATMIALAKPDSDLLEVVAMGGPEREAAVAFRLSVDPDRPEGRGLAGMAFRSRRPCISNDYFADARLTYFYDIFRKGGARSGAAFPLIKGGKSIGVLIFLSAEVGTFQPDLNALLQKLADNVSFAVENFDRAEEKAKADERVKYLAAYDSLTGLPNRSSFSQLLNSTLVAARRCRGKVALFFIDLDRFKIINDTLGHAEGDALLVEIASRLRQALREQDVVARLGGDEFVAILPEPGRKADINRMAHKLLSAVMKPMLLKGQECRVTASIGVALYPDDGRDEQSLVKRADLAMYLAKEEGKNDVRFFSKRANTQSIERLVMESNLRKALERNEFTLHYQPKINLRTSQITGIEALIRWGQPDLGLLPPAQFIPVSEETGLIIPIGKWVIKTACEQHMSWRNEGFPPVRMAINLSPRQFQYELLLQDIDEILTRTGMDPEFLELEVTETMVMQNVDQAIKVLSAIKRRGIHIAMDDFGTGYSSMSLIKRFPIDTLKIDRAFIRQLPQDKEDRAITDAIINLGRALGLRVVAEGVENDEQEVFLRDHACDEMQGYLFSRPIPPEEISVLLGQRAIASPNLQPEACVHFTGPMTEKRV
ncbi:EAL domain-containing protein [Bradyrhizobium tropiciagri]|uniref:bifunctional diguanylate cyclase/phosphodiesterase n=1 Tax=Bradyrhizobium tropiciagri TaxID=312253 RepID=UPI001BADF705|nr:EAL domain-containing protein [Bradyrhizobium tropiciagri]MBR0898940.1 EAL domain-containing protein [Bradyrhizobium tropiciagri]